jgi:hypothetical protein
VASNEAEHVVSVVTIDIGFVEERVAGTIGLGELLDPGVIIGLLVIELVAWECKDFKAFVTIGIVDLCHPLIVTGGQASKACDVGDEGQFLSS